MTPDNSRLFIIFLRFGPQRARAGECMAGHRQWLQQGIADGSFLMAGSLDEAQGGVVLARGTDQDAMQQRVAQDPFVMHGVAVAEVHAVAPSMMAPAMAALWQGAQAGSDAA